ncbi:hypothetical protein J6590_075338 [Homalodisca vitripennis]|nr:hypothetical protein J6590_075338 [Homalodisca vitripennis]
MKPLSRARRAVKCFGQISGRWGVGDDGVVVPPRPVICDDQITPGERCGAPGNAACTRRGRLGHQPLATRLVLP